VLLPKGKNGTVKKIGNMRPPPLRKEEKGEGEHQNGVAKIIFQKSRLK
jgi:hypothetical protein